MLNRFHENPYNVMLGKSDYLMNSISDMRLVRDKKVREVTKTIKIHSHGTMNVQTKYDGNLAISSGPKCVMGRWINQLTKSPNKKQQSQNATLMKAFELF